MEQILRTVRRTPEVMVKVSGSASSAQKAVAHMVYVGRQGELAIETDDGQRLSGPSAAQSLSDAWQLGIDELVARNPYKGTSGRRAAKLTHHIVLSMPAETPPERLLKAAQGFARDEFALQHQYAMALHTDQEHPHVHLVVRAMGNNGRRLAHPVCRAVACARHRGECHARMGSGTFVQRPARWALSGGDARGRAGHVGKVGARADQ
jgi:hypothetical protein